MISLPPVYTGERDDEACYRWISNMKIYLTGYTILNPTINEEEQVILLSSFLRDGALEFWRYRTAGRVDNNNSRVPRKLSAAFELLANYFSPSNEERIARWNNMRQTDSISQLAEACCVLHNVIIPPMTQAQLKEKFWSAIDASIVSIIEEDHYLSVEDISFEKLVHAALKAENIANRSFGSGRTAGSSLNNRQATAVQTGLEANSSWRSTLPVSVSQSLEKYHGNKQSKDMNQAMMDVTLLDRNIDQDNTARSSIFSKNPNNISLSTNMQSRPRRGIELSNNNISPSIDMQSRSRRGTDLNKSPNGISLSTDMQSRSKRGVDFSKMPKKGDKEWKEYCFARNACLNCGQLTHTRSACPDRKD